MSRTGCSRRAPSTGCCCATTMPTAGSLPPGSASGREERGAGRRGVGEQVVLEAKYSGYIDRQAAEVERFRKLEDRRIPPHFDYAAVPQLRQEARGKLNRGR